MLSASALCHSCCVGDAFRHGQGAAAVPGNTVTSNEEDGLFLSCTSYFMCHAPCPYPFLARGVRPQQPGLTQLHPLGPGRCHGVLLPEQVEGRSPKENQASDKGRMAAVMVCAWRREVVLREAKH